MKLIKIIGGILLGVIATIVSTRIIVLFYNILPSQLLAPHTVLGDVLTTPAGIVILFAVTLAIPTLILTILLVRFKVSENMFKAIIITLLALLPLTLAGTVTPTTGGDREGIATLLALGYPLYLAFIMPFLLGINTIMYKRLQTKLTSSPNGNS